MISSLLRSVCVGLILIVVLSGCGPSTVWNGTWKLNESRSNIPGPTATISLKPTGEYHTDNGTFSYSFACNGKEYPTTPNRTLSCTQKSPFVMDTTSKQNGTKVEAAHWELTADGKLLTITSTSFQANGSAKSKESVFERSSGSNGFVGGWKNTRPFGTGGRLLVLALKDGRLHFAFPESGQYADLTLDGSDAIMHGSGAPAGQTMAMKPRGSRELLTLKKFQGKIVNQGSLRISADGRILVEEYWRPGSNEKAALVYDKQ